MDPSMGQQPGAPMPTAVTKQLAYDKTPLSHPNYRLGIVSTLTNSPTVAITSASTIESLFEFGTNVFNLARSFLSFDYSIPAQAATFYSNVFANGFPFASTITLQTRTGIMLCEMNYANFVTNIWATKEVNIQELMQADSVQFIYASQLAAANNLRPQGTAFPGVINFTEPQYNIQSGLITAAGGYVRFPFSSFKNTIFALDKDLLFGEVIVMRLLWGPSTNIGFINTSAANLSTGAAAFPAGAAGTITINNLRVYLAYEQDSQIIAGMRAKLNEGFTFPIPYVYAFRTPTAAATTSTVNSRLNRGFGITLKKYVVTAYDASGAANLVYDRSNISGAPTFNGTNITPGAASQKIQSFYTQINNARVEDITLQTNLYEDYMYMLPILKYSVNQRKETYYYNWFYALHFDGMENVVLKDYFEAPGLPAIASLDNLVSGLALNNSECLITHNSSVTANAAYNYLSVFATLKILTCSPTTTSCL